MKTIIFASLFLCILVTAINADKSHKHQDKLLKSGHEEHKNQVAEIQPVHMDEKKKIENHNPINEQAETKPTTATGRKHRKNHHGKNKKGGSHTEAHTGRSRKAQQPKPIKHNDQRSHHNNKQHGRKHGRGKQVQ